MAEISQTTYWNAFSWKKTRISIDISPNCVPKGQINNITALAQIMAWCRPGDNPLSEAMMVRLPTDIWVTQPQWVNSFRYQTICSIHRTLQLNISIADRVQVSDSISVIAVPTGVSAVSLPINYFQQPSADQITSFNIGGEIWRNLTALRALRSHLSLYYSIRVNLYCKVLTK